MTDEKPDTYNRLLAVGSDMFASLGYQQTRTQDICREAGTNAAAVNYHFGGKDGLYKAVWDYALQLAISETRERMVLSRDSDRNWLYSYVYTAVLAVFKLGPRGYLRKLIEHELKAPSPLSDIIMESHILPRMAEIEKRLRRMLGARTSEFQLTCCMVAIYSQCTALNVSRYLNQRLFDGQEPTEEDAQRFAREMCAFIMGGMRAMRN